MLSASLVFKLLQKCGKSLNNWVNYSTSERVPIISWPRFSMPRSWRCLLPFFENYANCSFLIKWLQPKNVKIWSYFIETRKKPTSETPSIYMGKPEIPVAKSNGSRTFRLGSFRKYGLWFEAMQYSPPFRMYNWFGYTLLPPRQIF